MIDKGDAVASQENRLRPHHASVRPLPGTISHPAPMRDTNQIAQPCLAVTGAAKLRGQQFGEMDGAVAVPGGPLHLGPAAEPVGEDGGARLRRPDRGQQHPARSGVLCTSPAASPNWTAP